jgi:ankyrin repeat protein
MSKIENGRTATRIAAISGDALILALLLRRP